MNFTSSPNVHERRLALCLDELRQAICDAASARLDFIEDGVWRRERGTGSLRAPGAPSDADDVMLAEMQRCESALRRIETGTFGHCVGCGVAIEPQRLDAQPATERCAACQKVFDRGIFAAGAVR